MKATWIESLIAWVFLVFASMLADRGLYGCTVLAFGIFIMLTPKN